MVYTCSQEYNQWILLYLGAHSDIVCLREMWLLDYAVTALILQENIGRRVSNEICFLASSIDNSVELSPFWGQVYLYIYITIELKHYNNSLNSSAL